MSTSRRQFLTHAGAISAAFAGLRARAAAQPRPITRSDSFGDLVTDGDFDLELPPGFEARLISTAGDEMDDGLLLPGGPDGMAAFPSGEEGVTLVVRNHELTAGVGGAFGPANERLARVAADRIYDAGHGQTPARGGTSTFAYDTASGTLLAQHMSLAGTVRNCAGGATPWGSWVTCEEAVNLPDEQHEQAHGYCFEVPADARELVEPVPLRDMGRFNHEAIAVDPASGVVYLTEDRPDSLLYRYLPDHAEHLAEGGKLQALAIRGAKSVDTRNWSRYASFPVGEAVEVEWDDLDDIDTPEDDLRTRGFLKGAARFARGEGMWTDKGAIWFACTSGGPNQAGQVWRYTPSPKEGRQLERKTRATLELFFEPNDKEQIDMCDNLTVAPWGDLILCEDGSGTDRLIGVTPAGLAYPLARNAKSDSELTGVCFSPDGSTLFVNVQGSGKTYAVVGPWPTA